MAAGIIPRSNFPSPLPDGFVAACEAAGVGFFIRPDGVFVSNIAFVTNLIATYTGSASELTFAKAQKQQALDDFFNAHFDLAEFIRGGTATGITGAQVGTFLASITNNYRTLRANITAAANVAAVNAINVQGGWPSNP